MSAVLCPNLLLPAGSGSCRKKQLARAVVLVYDNSYYEHWRSINNFVYGAFCLSSNREQRSSATFIKVCGASFLVIERTDDIVNASTIVTRCNEAAR